MRNKGASPRRKKKTLAHFLNSSSLTELVFDAFAPSGDLSLTENELLGLKVKDH